MSNIVINNSNFKLEEIPNYHPASQNYIKFWREQKRRCIEGFWSQGKWMPGKLYFYINFAIIKLNVKGSKVKSFGNPLLRDIEWETFLLWDEARGFSGFLEDEEYSCNEIIPKLYGTQGELSPSIIKNNPNIFTPKGLLKKYIPAREYLRMIHPKNLGRPLYENQSKNLFILGSRGWGKSYSVGGIVAHEYTFDGQTEYKVGISATSSEIVVGAGDAKYSSETLAKTRIMLERLPGAYEQGDKYYPAPFFKKYIGSWEPAKQISNKYKEKVNNNWVWSGTGSNIKHRTFKDNPFAANGTRPGTMIFEEVGFFDNLLESYGASVECQRDGSDKFGSMLFIGTGGDMDGGSTLGAQSLFYNPNAYDCLTFEDIWEFRGEIGYFLPAYLGLAKFKDENGITDIEAAKAHLEGIRNKLKNTKGSSTTLEKEIINRPLVPSEMFLQAVGNLFPVPELRNRLAQLETEEKWESLAKPVELFFDPKSTEYQGVNYKIDVEKKLKPINKFPWQDHNRQGAVVIYEFPQLIDGQVPEDTYIIGHDPYRSDSTTGESLASIIVLKTKKHFTSIGHDEVVAVYAGRPFEGRQVVNEILYKLALFYNAQIFFENAVGNVKEYFEKIKKLKMLARRPRTVLNKKASFTQTVSQEYGYPMSSRQMKLEGVAYIREWLLEERGKDKNGQVLRNLDRIWDRALLQELISFNLDGNFDRVMGLMGAIIGLNETYNQFKENMENEKVVSFRDEFNKIFTNNKFIFARKNLLVNDQEFKKERTILQY